MKRRKMKERKEKKEDREQSEKILRLKLKKERSVEKGLEKRERKSEKVGIL